MITRKCLLLLSLSLFFTLLFITPVSAQVLPTFKTTRTLVYEAIYKDSTWTTGKVVDFIYFAKYDSLGRVSVYNTLTPSGSAHKKILFRYNKEGRVSDEIYATAADGIVKYWKYQYNQQGLLNFVAILNDKGDTLSVQTALRDAKGRVVKKMLKDYQKGTTKGEQLVYDDQGKLIKKVISLPNGKFKIQDKSFWQGDTLLVNNNYAFSHRPLFEELKVDERIVETDDYGNWTVKYEFEKDGIQPDFITCRTIEYAGVQNDWRDMLLQGKVKSVRQSSYVAIPKGPNAVDKGQKKGLFFFYSFDQKGHKTQEHTFTDQGVLTAKKLYEYDAAGKLKSEMCKSPTGTLLERKEYNYGSAGRLRAASVYDKQGKNYKTEVYRYDLEGNRVVEAVFLNDGTKCKELRYKYNSYGLPVESEVVQQSDKEATIYPFKREWDFEGRLLAEAVLLFPGVGRHLYTYRYNSKGQIIGGTEQPNGQPIVTYIYKFNKDDVGNWKIRIKYVDDVPVLYEEREYTYY